MAEGDKNFINVQGLSNSQENATQIAIAGTINQEGLLIWLEYHSRGFTVVGVQRYSLVKVSVYFSRHIQYLCTSGSGYYFCHHTCLIHVSFLLSDHPGAFNIEKSLLIAVGLIGILLLGRFVANLGFYAR